MTEKVYGIWINDMMWKQDSKGFIIHSPYRNVLAAEVIHKGELWKTIWGNEGWETISVEIIGEDGQPERKRPPAIPSWVSHAPPEEESSD